MSIKSKLDYLIETKEKIKKGISALGPEITSNNFRNFVQAVYDLYSNWYEELEYDLNELQNVETPSFKYISNSTKDKLEYIQVTKELLLKALNVLGAELTDENTFRSYYDALRKIYDEYPKINAEGTNLSVQNAKKGKIEYLLKGDTKQNIMGKNLLPSFGSGSGVNVSISSSDYQVTINGTTNNSGEIISTNTFTLPAGTYRLNRKYVSGTMSSKLAVVLKRVGTSSYLITTNLSTSNYKFNMSDSFTVNAPTKLAFGFKFDTNNRTFYNLKFNFQITEGSTADYDFEQYINNPPTPSNPVPINVVTGLQEIEVCGKNLFDDTRWKQGDLTTSSAGSRVTSTQILWLEAGTYTFSCNITSPYRYALQGQIIGEIPLNSYPTLIFNPGWTTSANPTKTFTLTQGMWIDVCMSKEDNSNLTPSDISGFHYQIEKGNQATTYEPYIGNTYKINLGKNLFKYPYYNTTTTTNGITFTDNGDGSITINGTSTAQAIFYLDYSGGWSYHASNIIEPGTYTLSPLTTDNNVYLYINLYNPDNTNTTQYTYHTKTTFTVTGTKSIEVPRIVVSSGYTFNNVRVFPQLEKGSQATSYSLYFTPIELGEIGNYKDLIFKGKGINLFDKNNVRAGYRLTDSGYYADNGYNATEFIGVKPSTTYSTSWTMDWSECVCTYDINQTFIRRIMSGTGFTTSGTEYYIRADVKDAHLSTAQINEGNQVLPYEPYNAKDKWLLHKEIGKVVLNGSENWIFNNSYTYNVFYISIDTLKKELNVITTMSNYYKGVKNVGLADFGNTYNNSVAVRGYNDTYYHLYISNDTINSVADFKTWLSTHNTEVYYVLANPTTTEITNEELISQLEAKIKSYDNLTNILTIGDLPVIINVGILQKG